VTRDELGVELDGGREQPAVRVRQLTVVAGGAGCPPDPVDGRGVRDVDVHPTALLGVEPEGVFTLQLRLDGRDGRGLVVRVVAVDERGGVEYLHRRYAGRTSM